MKRLLIPLLFAVCVPIYAQFIEDFSDSNYTANPLWEGTYSNFAINPYLQLQTKAAESATSYLSTASKAQTNAEWSFWCRIASEPTQNNYFRFYLISDTQDPTQGNGIYVQVGGSNKNITLYMQAGDNRQLLIENEQRKQILAHTDNKVFIRISTDEKGLFSLYSRVLNTDDDYVLEGTYILCRNNIRCNYFSILVRNTMQTGQDYYVDDIIVSGDSADIIEVPTSQGDLIINEIMFDPADNGQEYVEIYNRDTALADLSDIVLTTRNEDGEFRTPNKFPASSAIYPNDYAVLCKNATDLIAFHNIENADNIYSCSWSRRLSNTGATLYLLRIEDSDTTILDSVSYSPRWHHLLLDSTKGVSLERINPYLESNDASSWHSASKDQDYATPGKENSQYRDINNDEENTTRHHAWLEEDSFTPNGDGWKDVCLIYYQLPTEGYVANVRIFTPRGSLIAYPHKNATVSTEGALVWNGTLTNNRIAEVGIYVIVCEFTNPTTGKSIKERFPVVIADR